MSQSYGSAQTTSPAAPPYPAQSAQPYPAQPYPAQPAQPYPAQSAPQQPEAVSQPLEGQTTGQQPAPRPGLDERGHVRRTRTGQLYLALAVGTLLLIALIVFIAQNTDDVAIHFLGFNGHFPLALALLIAAVTGSLIAVVIGGVRILQLRHALKRTAPHEGHRSRH